MFALTRFALPLLALPVLAFGHRGEALGILGEEDPPGAPRASDDDVRRAWSLLTDDERRDVALHFAEEARWLEGLQSALIAHALSLEETDPGFFPEAGEPPFFDPKLHAPAQPIPRERLDPHSAPAREAVERMKKREPKTGLDAAFRYDWARREIVRSGDAEAPERVFANGLAGHPPRYDLALAIVERTLDRGDQAKALAAFGHAYTDRAGAVFPGLTLYDAWASGTEIEMPDVDVLGVVHDVLGDWKTWKAIIPASQHDAIYDEVGKHFLRARDYRSLRNALAWTYLSGSVALADAYVGHRLRLHGLWESVSSMPTELAPKLPDADGRQDYLVAWSDAFDKDSKFVPRAQARLAELDRDAARVRETLARIVLATGALERKQRPAPKPKTKAANSGG
ncbi:MAG: hypothetical protein HZA52_04055 [Planctomycetes bacterium]|nr:hypothetical protein [Planctomycetota bacterium]